MAYPTAMLSADVGVFFDARDVGLLEEPLRSRIYTAMRDAPTGGLAPSSLRRSPWQQYLLRRGRCPGMEFSTSCKGRPVTALPYRSNHQKGTAADMGGRELWWLIAHEREYGLHRPIRSENWHFEAYGTPTRRIIPYPGGTGGQPLPPSASEFFGMDEREARQRFDTLEDKLDTVIGGMMTAEAKDSRTRGLIDNAARRVKRLYQDRFGQNAW